MAKTCASSRPIYVLRWLLPRPPRPTMPTLTLSFAPHTRTADAAVKAPRKNLRVFGSDTTRLLACRLYQGAGWILQAMPPGRVPADPSVPTTIWRSGAARAVAHRTFAVILCDLPSATSALDPQLVREFCR